MLQIDQRHGVPATLVANAIETRTHNLREARRGRDELIDEHWCVFDHDDHPHLEASITAANVNGIEIASSNPCFELWLLLHYVDLRRHEHRHAVQVLAQQHLPGLAHDPKGITGAQAAALSVLYPTAKNRALTLDDMHLQNQSPPRSNPSTDVWRIVDRLTARLQ